MATARTITADKFTLTLDGVSCGFVDTIQGGDIFAEVVDYRSGGTLFAKKILGRSKYEPFNVQVGFGMARPVYDWIAASWTGNFQRKEGAITTVDANLNAAAQSEFSRALISAVTMPALDAASKDAARITLTFTPELTRFAKASGKVPAGTARAKRVTAANFRLELDAVVCSNVRKIEAFTVLIPLVTVSVGGARDVHEEATQVEFPNLSVTIVDGPAAASWQTWFEQAVINGQAGTGGKNGAIVYLAADMKTEVARVALHNVGICALRRHQHRSGSEGARTLVAELYCERMELQVGQPAPTKPVGKPVKPIATPTKPARIPR